MARSINRAINLVGRGRATGKNPAQSLSTAQALAGRLPPLVVEAIRIADTVASGAHGRRRAGPGDSFWQFRPYVSGDTAQAIDWRVSARSDQLFVREREWSAAASLYLWRDASASMRWRGARDRQSKQERADLLLLSLAALAIRGEEQVAILGLDKRGRQGRGALTHLAQAIGQGKDESLPPEGPLPRQADLVLFSDFFSPLDELAARLGILAARSARGLMVQIYDPAEAALPFEGRVRFEGLEGEGRWLAPRVETLRPAYIERFRDHQSALAGLAASLGWRFVALPTDRPAASALAALHAGLAPGLRGTA
ncbi:MAG: DUF58 domain-containing protein [Kiloniellales bacterium]